MSNSKVITGLLNTDCTIITDNLKSYMDTKLNEINTNMTATIQQHMTENIHKFYTGFGNLDDDDEITNILFDNVCNKTIIDGAIDAYTLSHKPNDNPSRYGSGSSVENRHTIIYLTKNLDSFTTPETQQYKSELINKINDTNKLIKRLNKWTPTQKCFKLSQSNNYYANYNGGSNQSGTSNIYYFNNFIISVIEHNTGDRHYPRNIEYLAKIHSLPYNMLFTIKNIFKDFNILYGYGAPLPDGFSNILEIYNKNPHYFMPNVREFETNCKIEYEDIEEKQSILDNLIKINKTKIDYYKKLEDEQTHIENKQQLLKIEKEKLAMAYSKFNLMRDTFIQEKKAFDLEIESIKQLKLETETQSLDIDKLLQ